MADGDLPTRTTQEGEEARHRILDTLQTDPGLHLGALARELDMGWGTLHHHLHVLERRGDVVFEGEGNRVRVFPGDATDPEERHRFALLANDAVASTLALVEAHPGLTRRELADFLGITTSAARKRLAKLEKEGLVGAHSEGRVTHYTAIPAPTPTSSLQADLDARKIRDDPETDRDPVRDAATRERAARAAVDPASGRDRSEATETRDRNEGRRAAKEDDEDEETKDASAKDDAATAD